MHSTKVGQMSKDNPQIDFDINNKLKEGFKLIQEALSILNDRKPKPPACKDWPRMYSERGQNYPHKVERIEGVTSHFAQLDSVAIERVALQGFRVNEPRGLIIEGPIQIPSCLIGLGLNNRRISKRKRRFKRFQKNNK